MPNLDYDTGLKVFTINNDENRTISFSPADFNFIQKLYTAFEKLEATQNKWAALAQNVNGDVHKMIDIINNADKEIRGIVDDTFGPDTSAKAFGDLSTYALADGAPIWAGFVVAVMEQCDNGITANQKATNPKLQKLLKKYQKK